MMAMLNLQGWLLPFPNLCFSYLPWMIHYMLHPCFWVSLREHGLVEGVVVLNNAFGPEGYGRCESITNHETTVAFVCAEGKPSHLKALIA